VKWSRYWVNRLGLGPRPRVRKLIVGLIGSTVVLFGLALVILPGPAVLVIPLGLAILATEFAWARHLIKRGETWWEKRGRWRWLGRKETGQ
jgi:Putative transmembrane protein (PGPGW)